MVQYTKNVSEPWFSLIKLGLKTCEGRLNKGDFKIMKKGDILKFVNNDFGFPRMIKCRITSVNIYDSFKDYLKNESLKKCLPGIDTINNGIKIYYKYYSSVDELKYKIKAIKVKVIK